MSSFSTTVPRAARACLMAALLAAALPVQACRLDGLSVPFEAPGKVSVFMSTDYSGERAGELPADFFGNGGLRLPDVEGGARATGIPQVASLAISGRLYPVLGSLAVAFGVTWTYGAHGVSTTLDGKPFYLSRKALEPYPDLLARLQAARIDFDQVQVRFTADIATPDGKGIQHEGLTVTLPRATFIVPNEGEGPFAAAAEPDRWSDRLQLTRPGLDHKGYVSEEELPALWNRVVALRCASVTFTNLRVPHREFERIAQLLVQNQGQDAKLARDTAMLQEGLGKDAPAPYAGKGEMAKPFAIPVTTAEGFRTSHGVGLKKDGKTLWESGDYASIDRIDKEGRLHRVFLKNADRRFRIVDARGRVQQVAGVSDFSYLDTSGLDKGTLRVGIRDGSTFAFETRKSYGGRPIIMESELQAFRAADGDGRCRISRGGGGLSIRTDFRIQYTRGTIHTVSDRLKLVRSETAYFPAGTARDSVGDTICRAP
jgi:hypothetical protein